MQFIQNRIRIRPGQIEILVGDIVELKPSGAGLMHVRDIEVDTVFCSWFDKRGAQHVDPFLASALQLVARLPATESPAQES